MPAPPALLLPPPAVVRAPQPELLGLRALAVGLVILGHWTLPVFPLSELGRLSPFVLSGYLISGIIWKNDVYWGGRPGWARRLGTFYTRRFLRIVPPYYAALALAALLPLLTLRQYPAWFLLLVPNQLCFRLQAWPEGLGHYWTLGVEEQFYLLWPLLLTLLGQRRRVAGLWLLIALSTGFRAWAVLVLSPARPVFGTVLLPACLDLLAVGALLRLHVAAAAARVAAPSSANPPAPRRPWPGWPALAMGLVWVLTWKLLRHSPRTEQAWFIVSPSLGAVASYLGLRWLLGAPASGRWLAHPVAQWLGRRSYGLYLYHLLLPVFYQRLVFKLLPIAGLTAGPGAAAWRAWWLGPLPTVLVLGPLAVLLCAASWRWLEAPLERLKGRFTYAARPSAPAPAPLPLPTSG